MMDLKHGLKCGLKHGLKGVPIVVYRVFDRLQHELRTEDPCSLKATNHFFTFDAICNFRLGGFKKYRIEYSSVFNSFQVVSLFFFVSEPSGSLK